MRQCGAYAMVMHVTAVAAPLLRETLCAACACCGGGVLTAPETAAAGARDAS